MLYRLVLIVVLTASGLLASCGRTPLGGLDGEFCAADSDCIEGLVCERSTCLSVDAAPLRSGVFFVGLRLIEFQYDVVFDEFGQPDSNQLIELGVFISDLSEARYPYYAGHAATESQLDFGMADRELDPVLLDASNPITSLTMRLGVSGYVTDTQTIILPVVFSNDEVNLDVDLPLVDAFLQFNLQGSSENGNGLLMGSVRAVDAENLSITAGGDTFTLFDLLRQVDLNVDTDFDGVPDAWSMSWVVAAEVI